MVKGTRELVPLTFDGADGVSALEYDGDKKGYHACKVWVEFARS